MGPGFRRGAASGSPEIYGMLAQRIKELLGHLMRWLFPLWVALFGIVAISDGATAHFMPTLRSDFQANASPVSVSVKIGIIDSSYKISHHRRTVLIILSIPGNR
jgi:hypothetical protein